MTTTTTLTAPETRQDTLRPGTGRHVWKTGAVAGVSASVATFAFAALARLHRYDDAARAYDRALALTNNAAEHAHLDRHRRVLPRPQHAAPGADRVTRTVDEFEPLEPLDVDPALLA